MTEDDIGWIETELGIQCSDKLRAFFLAVAPDPDDECDWYTAEWVVESTKRLREGPWNWPHHLVALLGIDGTEYYVDASSESGQIYLADGGCLHLFADGGNLETALDEHDDADVTIDPDRVVIPPIDRDRLIAELERDLHENRRTLPWVAAFNVLVGAIGIGALLMPIPARAWVGCIAIPLFFILLISWLPEVFSQGTLRQQLQRVRDHTGDARES